MPRYLVKENGFWAGTLYSPTGKRPILITDKEINPCPSWLEPIKDETAAQKGARTKAENKAKEEADKRAEKDAADIASVTFATTPEQTTKTL